MNCAQYAHCQWGWTSADGLFFANLEQLADQQDRISNVMDQRRYIDVPLLQEQEAYCNYVRESFTYLDAAYRAWDRAKVAVTPLSYIHPKPSTITRPALISEASPPSICSTDDAAALGHRAHGATTVVSLPLLTPTGRPTIISLSLAASDGALPARDPVDFLHC